MDRSEEHREVAKRMPEEFTREEFQSLYVKLYPHRPLELIMPYEFCDNRHHNKTATKGPKFLTFLGRGHYRRGNI